MVLPTKLKKFGLAFCASLALTTGTVIPALGTDIVAIDFCADLKTAVVSPIAEGTCAVGQLSLGAGPIERGDKRPKALIPQFKNRYVVAKIAAKKKGFTLQVTSGWRSYSYQAKLFKRAIKRNGSVAEASKWVLPPEKSNHPWGLAVDVNYGTGGAKGKKAAAWLEKNGFEYGLCRRYENEWWHFEPLVAPGQPCPAMEPYAS
jgi:hypothetical protein